MKKYKDNDIVHYWTIIGYDKSSSKYMTRCVCGKESLVSSSTLNSGKSKSCGCKQKDSVASRIKSSNFSSIRKKIYSNYERASIKRGYKFELSFDVFSKLISENCHYCGNEPNMTYKYGRGIPSIDYEQFMYNGVDRVDNSIGYLELNCVPCCKICNNSKSTLTLEEWKEWLQKIYKNMLR